MSHIRMSRPNLPLLLWAHGHSFSFQLTHMLAPVRESVLIVGDWRIEGGMGVIDVGEIAVVRVGKAALLALGAFGGASLRENVQIMGTMPEDAEAIGASSLL